MLKLEITLTMVIIRLLFSMKWKAPREVVLIRVLYISSTKLCYIFMREKSHGRFRSVKQVPFCIHILCALILNRRPLFTWLSPHRYCPWHSIQPGLLIHTQESACRFKLTNIILHVHNNKPSSVQVCRYLHPGYPLLKEANSDYGMDK